MQAVLETGVAALLFAGTFLVRGGVHPFRTLIRDGRTVVSFGGGMAAAYVFVHVMPEMHDARQTFVASMSVWLRYEGMAIYFVALLGFLAFYGLDHLRRRVGDADDTQSAGKAFRLHVGGFAAYVWLMAYLLAHYPGETRTPTVLYAVAITFHFVGVDHALRKEHGAAYERVGRFVLAAMCVAGWAAGLLHALPPAVLALLVAFISGAIIMNSLIMELPSKKEGRFLPFMTGGVVYGLILLPLG